MLHQRVNGYDLAYIEVGQGEPLVCIHGSLNDFRVWSPVLGPLSRRHRVIAPSLRGFFPEHWDGVGEGFTIAQHVADLIAFLEALDGKVNLVGHSRGGHIAFRLAQQRPDLLRRLVLAEPGGDLDPSRAPEERARCRRCAPVSLRLWIKLRPAMLMPGWHRSLMLSTVQGRGRIHRRPYDRDCG